MSRLNPSVMAYVPRKVEAATKTIRTEPLTHPLPAKPLPGQSSPHIRQPGVHEIVTSDVQIQRLENARVIHPPAKPSVAFQSRRYLANKYKRQRRNHQPLVDWSNTPPELRTTTKEKVILSQPDIKADQEPIKQTPIQNLRKGARQVKCHRSPYLPQTAKKWDQYKKQMRQEHDRKRLKAEKIRIEGEKDPKVENDGNDCMGGKTFRTNHSAVLASKTIWCPQTWPDEQEEAIWPIQIEFNTEGWDRQRHGFGRYYPVPRSQEFEWRLATPEWLADPKATKRPVWDGVGPIPPLEKRFARVRGELDCIAGSGRRVDADFLFARAEETAWEDGAAVIGKTLWEMIEDEVEDIEEDLEEDLEGEVGNKIENSAEEEKVVEEAEEEIETNEGGVQDRAEQDTNDGVNVEMRKK